MSKNFGDKLVGSIGGVVIGVIVFLLSFVVLFNAEGRTDYSVVAKKAVSVEEASGDQDFVYVTGNLLTEGQIGDDTYLLEDDYAAVDRKVEVFSWVENVKRDENDVKYYEYNREWVDTPPDTDKFHERRGHENYEKEVQDLRKLAPKGFIGDYEVSMDKVKLPSFKKLNLNDENVYLDSYSEIIDNHVFVGYGSYSDPDIGDMRIGYSVVPTGDKATVFGRPDGKKIDPHHGENEKGLYRIMWGTVDDAGTKLKEEYKTQGWMYRIGGFLMMWIGLLLIFKPLTVAFELLPFVSKLGKAAVSAVTFLVALILTTIVSTVSMVLHNPIGIAAIVVVVVGGIYWFMFNKQKTAKAGGGPAKGAPEKK